MEHLKKTPRSGVYYLIAAILVLTAAVIVPAAGSAGRRRSAAGDISDAVAVLRQMEAGDPDHVLETLRQQQNAKIQAQWEELKAKLLDGEIDVWSQFQDYVILGDSRPAGFYYYGLLPGERNLSDAGQTIRELRDMIPEIAALRPARAYLSYGINDINIGYWDTPEEYIAEFIEILDELTEAVPGIEVYVNSILEVQDWALYKGAKWKDAPIYNEAIREMCGQYGYTYIDNTGITAEHQELYDEDGIHFQKEFYSYWAMNMILATYDRGAEEAISQ